MVANKGRFLRFGQRLVPRGARDAVGRHRGRHQPLVRRVHPGSVRPRGAVRAVRGHRRGFIFGVASRSSSRCSRPCSSRSPTSGSCCRGSPLAARPWCSHRVLVPVPIVLLIGLLVIQNIVVAAGHGQRRGHEPDPGPRGGVRGRPGRGGHRRRLRGAGRGRGRDPVQRVAGPGAPACRVDAT